MKIEEVDNLVEPLGWERDLCHDGDCFPELNKSTKGHEGSYKKFNMTEHGEDGYISYESLNEIIEEAVKPKLTIPESVVKELDVNWEKEKSVLEFAQKMYQTLPTEVIGLAPWDNPNSFWQHNVSLIYLASKALGINLVEVVPDED